MKTRQLKLLTLLMCFFNICAFVFVNWGAESTTLELTLIGLIVLITFAILYYFWLGRNWARILVIIASVLALLNLLLLSNSTIPQQIVIILEAILAVYLLYWLNTAEVKCFFRKENQGESRGYN